MGVARASCPKFSLSGLSDTASHGCGWRADLALSCCQVEVDAARLETLVGKPRSWPSGKLDRVELDGLVVEDLIGAGGMGT